MNWRGIGILLSFFALTGCGFLKKDKPTVEGRREIALPVDESLTPDPSVVSSPIRLPAAVINKNWPQSGGIPSHYIPHLALNDSIKVSHQVSIKSGFSLSQDIHLLSGPIIVGKDVYVLNGRGEIQALKIDGRSELITSIIPEGATYQMGGGLSFNQGILFVGSPNAEVLALDPKEKKILWRTKTTSPIRSAPTVSKGKVFAININNELIALDAKSGQQLWRHQGISETAGILGSASPCIDGDTVIVPYSSGEIYALHAENGHLLWSHNLASLQHIDSVSAIPHIRAHPVIAGNTVYLISQNGQISTVDLISGQVKWTRQIGGVQSPIIAGDHLFLIASSGHLICMTQESGLIKWVTSLPRFENPEDHKGRLVWSGPLLAGGKLYITGSNGYLHVFDPETGKEAEKIPLGSKAYLPPIVVDQTMYVLSADGNLSILQ